MKKKLDQEKRANRLAARLRKLSRAAQRVVNRWEHGDLAEAVRMLQSEIDKNGCTDVPARVGTDAEYV
jgi:hypothetical protein